jgi:transcriptional regulator with XRE-family HTH domain
MPLEEADGAVIRMAIRLAGVKQEDVADKLGFTPSWLSQVLKGKRQTSEQKIVELIDIVTGHLTGRVSTHPSAWQVEREVGDMLSKLEQVRRKYAVGPIRPGARPGEVVEYGSSSFVETEVYREALENFLERPRTIQLVGPPHSGKSTILTHLGREASKREYKVATIDFTQFVDADLGGRAFKPRAKAERTGSTQYVSQGTEAEPTGPLQPNGERRVVADPSPIARMIKALVTQMMSTFGFELERDKDGKIEPKDLPLVDLKSEDIHDWERSGRFQSWLRDEMKKAKKNGEGRKVLLVDGLDRLQFDLAHELILALRAINNDIGIYGLDLTMILAYSPLWPQLKARSPDGTLLESSSWEYGNRCSLAWFTENENKWLARRLGLPEEIGGDIWAATQGQPLLSHLILAREVDARTDSEGAGRSATEVARGISEIVHGRWWDPSSSLSIPHRRIASAHYRRIAKIYAHASSIDDWRDPNDLFRMSDGWWEEFRFVWRCLSEGDNQIPKHHSAIESPSGFLRENSVVRDSASTLASRCDFYTADLFKDIVSRAESSQSSRRPPVGANK